MFHSQISFKILSVLFSFLMSVEISSKGGTAPPTSKFAWFVLYLKTVNIFSKNDKCIV